LVDGATVHDLLPKPDDAVKEFEVEKYVEHSNMPKDMRMAF